MPIFKSRTVLETVRNIKLFLNLEAGVTRGPIPAASPPGPHEDGGQVPRWPEEGREIARPRTELTQVNDSPPDGAPPKFFLLGQAKSGTSWLMHLLHSHPEILCRGEGKFFGKDSHKSLHNALVRSPELQIWLGRNPWTWREQDPDLEDMLGALVNYLMQEKLDKTRKKIVGDKTPIESTQTVEDIAAICPGSKVVQIIRDGRDAAVSTVHHQWNNATDQGGGIKITPEQTAKREAYRSDPGAFGAGGESIFVEGQVAELARSWSTFVGRAIHDGHRLLDGDYHQVHYEDLLTEPVAEVRRVLEFLGADSTEEVVRRCVEAASFERKSSRKPGEEDATSFYRKGIAGDWKGVFTKEDRQFFREEAGDLLVELGYEKDGGW